MSSQVYADDHSSLRRDQHGILHIRSDNEAGLYAGSDSRTPATAACSCWFMRILGQGRTAELLDASLMGGIASCAE